MTYLIPKSSPNGGNGHRYEISDQDEQKRLPHQVREKTITEKDGSTTTVKEIVYINSGGYFSPQPILIGGQLHTFKTPHAQRKHFLDESYRLWKFDPIAGTIVNLTTFFVLGRGVTFEFDDEVAQFYANKFYDKNRLEIRLRRACAQFVALGELFIWLRPKFEDVTFEGKTIWRQGDTQITFCQVENITQIRIADDDAGDVYSYFYEYIDGEMQPYTIEIPDITKFSLDGPNARVGCMVHIKCNSADSDPFGLSDLVRIKEWLDNYQEYLRDGVVINKLYRSPCFDVSIEDASPDEVDAAVSRYRGWQIGSNPVHNAKEQWKILEFTGPNTSQETSRRALLLIIAAGVGFAEYMLADGANANLASSKSQQLPVIKKFEDLQQIFAYSLKVIVQYALYTKATLKLNSGLVFTTDRDGDLEEFAGSVTFPALAQESDWDVAQTNEKALQSGYMSHRSAAGRLNLDYDREMEQIKADKPNMDMLKSLGYNIQLGMPPLPPKPIVNTSGSNNSVPSNSSSSKP